VSQTTEPRPDDAQPRVSGRAKYLSLLLVVVGSGTILLSSTQPWFSARLTEGAGRTGALTVQGSAAAPALTALALAGLALTAALAIAGPVFRIVLAVLGLLLGVSVLISATGTLGDPVQAVSAAVTAATGVSGHSSVARLVASIDTQVWPAVAIAGGVILLLSSIGVVVTTRRWPGPSKRYQTRFEDENGASAADGFADLADDESPDQAGMTTDVAAHPEAGAGTPGQERKPATNDRDRAIDSWDELSRGEDPTR
jgi:uncharacterized membrane protein (TIGR02234 family)